MSRPGSLSLPLPGGHRVVATAERGPDDAGRFYWRVRLHGDGKRPTITDQVLGASAWATEAEAGKALAAYVAGARSAPASWTVRELLEEWLAVYEARGTLSPRTQLFARRTCDMLSLRGGRVMNMHLEDVRTGDLEDLADTWRGEDGEMLATSTRQQGLHLIGRAWKWALDRDRIDVRRPSIPKLRDPRPREKRRASREDAAALLAHLRLPWHRAAVELLWARGLRPGELNGIRVRDWSSTRGVLRVTGKTGQRDIPLGATTDAGRALSQLAEGLSPDASIWPVGKPAKAVQSFLRAASERAGLESLTPTAFRRVVVDRLYELDGDPVAAGKVVGHSPSTALVYRGKAKSSAIARAAAALDQDRLPRGQLIAIGDRRPHTSPQGPTDAAEGEE